MDPYMTRQLGRTNVHLTQLGLGCASIGSMYGYVEEEDGINIIKEAYQLGIRYFDTAPLYGYGSSERRVGAVLSKLPRDSFVISTKVGRLLVRNQKEGGKLKHFHDREPYSAMIDFSREGILRSLEESLQRLTLDSIDIIFIHDPQINMAQVLDETFPVLDQLRSEGVVKAIGAGSDYADVCRMLALFGDFDCFLLASRYTLLEQAAILEFLPLCEKKQIGIILGGVFNTGILAVGAVDGAYYDHRTAPPEIGTKVRAIERICEAYDIPMAAAALQFPFGHPTVLSVIPGARSAKRIAANADLMRIIIPESFWSTLKSEGLLSTQVPTPTDSLESIREL